MQHGCIWNVRIPWTRTAVKFKRWWIRQMAEQKWSALPWRKAWCYPQQSLLEFARVWLLWKHLSQPWVLQYASFPRNRLVYSVYYFFIFLGEEGRIYGFGAVIWLWILSYECISWHLGRSLWNRDDIVNTDIAAMEITPPSHLVRAENHCLYRIY